MCQVIVYSLKFKRKLHVSKEKNNNNNNQKKKKKNGQIDFTSVSF